MCKLLHHHVQQPVTVFRTIAVRLVSWNTGDCVLRQAWANPFKEEALKIAFLENDASTLGSAVWGDFDAAVHSKRKKTPNLLDLVVSYDNTGTAQI